MPRAGYAEIGNATVGIFFLNKSNQSINTFRFISVPSGPILLPIRLPDTTYNIMSLFSPPLILLFLLFSRFTVTRVYAQDLRTTSSNGGAIAGGIIAGLAAICIVAAAFFIYH